MNSYCSKLSLDARFGFGKWLSLAWLAVWLPTYATVWGWANFLHLCNVAVLLSCLGYLFESPLLLSSQALIAILGGFLWLVNYSSGLILGHPIFAGMEYMWDVNLPRWVRSLSLYHVALPVLLLAGLHHFGYDRRAWKLQGLISLLVICLSRLSSPAKNINFAFSDPLLQRAWGPAPVHVMVIWSGLMLLIYWPTHKVLSHVFLEPRELKC